jgi:hypothetical protein
VLCDWSDTYLWYVIEVTHTCGMWLKWHILVVCDWRVPPPLSYCIKVLGFLHDVIFWSGTNVSGLSVSPVFRVSMIPDYLEILKTGQTSSPATLVPDQKMTSCKLSKAFIQQILVFLTGYRLLFIQQISPGDKGQPRCQGQSLSHQ